MTRFWPPAEAAQADYERLRQAVLDDGRLPDDIASARFARRGLPGLIAWPAAEPVFAARFVGAVRPPWTPHSDPRRDALAETYQLLLDTADRAVGRDHQHAQGT